MHNRREFIAHTSAALGAMTLGVTTQGHTAAPNSEGYSSTGAATSIPGATGERIAAAMTSFYRAYRTRTMNESDITTWVQIDLGSSQPIDAIKLYPYSRPHFPPGDGFPLRFRLQCSDDPQFANSTLILDWTQRDFPDPEDQIVQFTARKARGRHVRLTVTRLRAQKPSGLFLAVMAAAGPAQKDNYLASIRGHYFLSLAKLEVLSNGVDLAVRRPVTVDSAYGNPHYAQQLTRPPRPQGEGVITDNPQNVTSPASWRPVAYRAQAPLGHVKLGDGLFNTALQNNVHYLLESFSVAELLRPFCERAGKPVAAGLRPPHPAWDGLLSGSNAGRFLMGAGNTLRWIENPELRTRMDAVVDGIAECRQNNGYIMAYPEDTIFVSERGAYTRAWVTHGLIEAGYAGNTKAFPLLRGYYDWYNQSSHLPQALRRCNFGPQGTVANARMYFTPVGKPQDLQVIQRYLQENYWLEALAARKVDSVWQYPYDRPHSYLLTFLEPYLDLYRATGQRSYLEAVLGAWDLFRENWQMSGGGISLLEFDDCPPKANSLYETKIELCGSVFWIRLNQRLHLLNPSEEKYVSEIEKSIYNVVLANQSQSKGFRGYSMLVGHKRAAECVSTCCEGQGTRVIASLPEYIYSLADDGIYVNLYERSSIDWQQAGKSFRLQMVTEFPKSPQVELTLHTPEPAAAKIRVRVPSWAAAPMEILVNRTLHGVGIPGSYVTVDRTWKQGDTVSFILPIALRMTHYTGIDQVSGRKRYSLEYGPILLAALNADDKLLSVEGESAAMLESTLKASTDQPLHFTSADGLMKWVPYYEIDGESFSCFPIVAHHTDSD